MASGRYDNIKYYDGNGNFKSPSQIKVFDGTDWVDYGTATSFNTKKINGYDGSKFNCFTYYRNDVNIPSYMRITSGRYIDLRKPNGTLMSIDTYNTGYLWEMEVAVHETTPLYTSYTKNQGDIINQSYVNYVAQVSDNLVRLKINTNFSGYRITDGKYIDSTSTKYTPYCFTVGEKVKIVMTTSANSGRLNVDIYNSSGTLLCEESISQNSQWVYTPNQHRLGSETTSKSGAQSSYGNAQIYYFKTTPVQSRSSVFYADITNSTVGSVNIWSSDSYSGYAGGVNTSVEGSSYTEYIRQEV